MCKNDWFCSTVTENTFLMEMCSEYSRSIDWLNIDYKLSLLTSFWCLWYIAINFVIVNLIQPIDIHTRTSCSRNAEQYTTYVQPAVVEIFVKYSVSSVVSLVSIIILSHSLNGYFNNRGLLVMKR